MSDKTEKEKLIEWYQKFIDLFRAEYEKLSDFEKSVIQNYDNFLAPCQIEIFWLKNPSFQLIVKSNFKDRPDREIIMNGPYDSHEFLEKLDSLINQPKWQTKVTRDDLERMMYDHERTYAEGLAHALSALIYYAKEFEFTPNPHKGDFGANGIDDHVWVYTFVGNKASLDYVAEVDKFIEQIKKNAIGHAEYLRQKEAGMFSQTQYEPSGHGVYLFPPIIVGSKPRLTPSEILRGKTVLFTGYEKAFHTNFNDLLIIAQKDGFIYVATPEKNLALKVLNTIMGVATLRGLQLSAVREHELSEAGHNKDTLAIGGFTFNMNTLRSVLFEERFGRTVLRDIKRKEVEADFLRKVIQDASEIFNNDSVSEELRILLEAITNLTDSEFAEAFFMGWIIIERHLSKIWDDYLSENKFDKKRIDKLQNTAQWSTDQWIEVLNMVDCIGKDDYDVYMSLKRKRNNLTHYGEKVSKEEAEKCVNIAKEIILKKISSIIKN